MNLLDLLGGCIDEVVLTNHGSEHLGDPFNILAGSLEGVGSSVFQWQHAIEEHTVGGKRIAENTDRAAFGGVFFHDGECARVFTGIFGVCVVAAGKCKGKHNDERKEFFHN